MKSVLSNNLMTVTKRKGVMIIYFFHLRHEIVINKYLNTYKINPNHMPIYQCWLKYKTGLIPPIYIAVISVYLDPSTGVRE